MTDDKLTPVTRAIFALNNPAPSGSEHYRAGWGDALDAAIDAARDALGGRTSTNNLPPLLKEVIQRIVRWDMDRQAMEYEQIVLEEQWEQLETGAFTLLANLARAVEDELTDVTDLPWKETPLL